MEPLLEAVDDSRREIPKWQTGYADFAQWSEPDEPGSSVLERA
jgi:hypothetical protein